VRSMTSQSGRQEARNIPILNILNVDRIAAMTSLEKTIVRSIDTDFDRSQPIESPRSTNEMWFDSASYLPNERQNEPRSNQCDMIRSTLTHQRRPTDDVSVYDQVNRYGRPYCLSSSSYRVSHRVSRIQSENVTTLVVASKDSKHMFCSLTVS
jgi:hypothetical protein